MEQVPMQPQPQGINLDPEILIQTQNNFIGQARVKEVQMEAAIAQLMNENAQLRARLAELEVSAEAVGETQEG